MVNFSPQVVAQLVKGASINLCSNLPGQITMANIMHPPQVRYHTYINIDSPTTLDAVSQPRNPLGLSPQQGHTAVLAQHARRRRPIPYEREP